MRAYGRIGPLYSSFYAPCAAVVESEVWVFNGGDDEIGAAWDWRLVVWWRFMDISEVISAFN